MHVRASVASVVCGFLLLVAAPYLWFDNPTVHVSASDVGGRGPAGDVDCSIAPWDAVLNDNRDGPGGEHSAAYSDEVAAECHVASSRRFGLAVGSGVVALLLLVGGAVSRLTGGQPART